MTRRLLNLLALLSLTLSVAVCVLWVRTRSRFDVILFGGGGGRLVKVWSDSHGVKVVTLRRWPDDEPLRWFRGEFASDDHAAATGIRYRDGSLREWEYAPLGVSAARWLTDYDEATGRTYSLAADVPAKSVQVPHGLLAVALAAPAGALAAVRAMGGARRRRAQTRSACPACGYDLRATPDRCPECGRTPEGAAA